MIHITLLVLILYLAVIEIHSLDCADNLTFRYNGEGHKTCIWIGEKSRRVARLCKKVEVVSTCILTCGVCYYDDLGSVVKSDQKRQSKWSSYESKLKGYCNNRILRIVCPKWCGICRPNDETCEFQMQSGTMKKYRWLNRKSKKSIRVLVKVKKRYLAACGYDSELLAQLSDIPALAVFSKNRGSASVIPSADPVSNPSTTRTEQLTALSQKEVLEIIYKKTGGDQWYNNAGWCSDKKECNWYGVTCVDGNVTNINLGGNGLTGTIPTEIGELKNLALLELSDNELTGTIPIVIDKLKNVRLLDLGKHFI